jgi:hypothetical protein
MLINETFPTAVYDPSEEAARTDHLVDYRQARENKHLIDRRKFETLGYKHCCIEFCGKNPVAACCGDSPVLSRTTPQRLVNNSG